MNFVRNAYLLLGSNLGNRMQFLQQAQQLIAASCGAIIAQSGVYETAAWGLTEQPSFYNCVLQLQTELQPDDLMTKLLAIETQLGRIRIVKYGARTIDIDILLIDDVVQATSLLVLPHPALPQRGFALLPLAEIAPNLFHPTEKITVQQLLVNCTDTLAVEKITVNS